MKKKIFIAIIVLIIAGVTGIGLFLKPETTPYLRGERVAQNSGCFGCHGPGGERGVANLGTDKDVPAWTGMSAMMYIKKTSEIREWIMYGYPLREKKEHEQSEAGEKEEDEHSEAGEKEEHGESEDEEEHEHENSTLKMPAFKDILSEKELDYLAEYFRITARWPEWDDKDVQKGIEIGDKAGCFSCHGALGHGHIKNPGSLKGYIPAWDGTDFKELVENDDEIFEWIKTGTIQRFEKNPLARYFLKKQLLKMPAYRDKLTDEEIKSMVKFIKKIRTGAL